MISGPCTMRHKFALQLVIYSFEPYKIHNAFSDKETEYIETP